MTKADLSKEEWNNITSDISDWKEGIESKSSKILGLKSRPTNGEVPNIRSSTKGFQNSKNMTGNKNEVTKRIKSLDYKSWEKFDAEEECKKMDLVEETKAEIEKRENSSESKRKKKMSIEELAIKSLDNIDNLSEAEREMMAAKEKDIGNELYGTNNVEESIKHYTRSIHLHLTVAGLNNRAAAYLRQCAFNKALDDLNRVLELDPENVKARFRRAQSFQHKNMYREALEDIHKVLAKEPSHVVSRHIADQLREMVSKLPKKHRIKIQDRDTGKYVIKIVSEQEMLNDYKNEKFIEVNDWGFPKIMCNCTGKYSNHPGIRREEHVRFQQNPPKKMMETKKQPEAKPIPLPLGPAVDVKPPSSGVKLEIIEVEKGSEETNSSELSSKEVAGTSSMDDPNSCIVADMRSSKLSSVPADRNEKLQKTNKNDKIKDNTTNTETSPSQSHQVNPKLTQLGFSVRNHILPVDQVKEEKTDTNITLQENRLVNGYVNRVQEQVSPGFEKRSSEMSCGCRDSFASFQFNNEWSALVGPDSLKRKAELLRTVCPQHMVQAFGNFWNPNMLIDVVKCLLHHFNHSEKQSAAEYVKALPRLDRFKINYMFLKEHEKSLIQELVKNCSLNTDATVISAFSS